MFNPDNIPLYQMQPILPSVLQRPKGNSVSVARILQAALAVVEGNFKIDCSKEILAEDLETLLAAIYRG